MEHRIVCVAIVDSGTSGIAVPEEYYWGIINYLTTGMNCKETECAGVSPADFPLLYVVLSPDNVFPLQPTDYIECTGLFHNFHVFENRNSLLFLLLLVFVRILCSV